MLFDILFRSPVKVLAPTRWSRQLGPDLPRDHLQEDEPQEETGPSCAPNVFKYNTELIPPEPEYFTAGFNRRREHQWVLSSDASRPLFTDVAPTFVSLKFIWRSFDNVAASSYNPFFKETSIS